MYYLLKLISFSGKKHFKKYWKMETNTGKVGEFCQSGKVGTILDKTCVHQLASQNFKVEAKFDLPTDLNIRAFRQNWQFYPSSLTVEVHN